MDSHIIEERGYFWWSDTPVPPGCFAPEAAITGTLRIDQDGQARLELDNFLRGEPANSIFGRQTELVGADVPSISGVLRNSRRRVKLWELRAGGISISDYGPSFEKITARTCLLLPGSRSASDVASECVGIELSLDGFGEWLDLGALTRTETKTGIIVEYKRRRDIKYELPEGKLAVRFDMDHQFDGFSKGASASFRESAAIQYTPRRALNLEEVKIFVSRFEDLLILLTNAERSLDWPAVKMRAEKGLGTLYYLRSKRSGEEVKQMECWVPFSAIRSQFGKIVSNWLAERERFGPGFYLYLGTRRGAALYEEHRFVSLVWGMESFHRTAYDEPPSNRLRAKIDRVLAQISRPKDRDWVERQLQHAAEPNLEARLYSLLAQAPVEFDLLGLHAFAKRCARHRNDISHFGSVRSSHADGQSLHNLNQLRVALDPLYHAVILLQIGVPRDQVKSIFASAYCGFLARRALADAGIVVDGADRYPPD